MIPIYGCSISWVISLLIEFDDESFLRRVRTGGAGIDRAEAVIRTLTRG